MRALFPPCLPSGLNPSNFFHSCTDDYARQFLVLYGLVLHTNPPPYFLQNHASYCIHLVRHPAHISANILGFKVLKFYTVCLSILSAFFSHILKACTAFSFVSLLLRIFPAYIYLHCELCLGACPPLSAYISLIRPFFPAHTHLHL
jgi:hypothetical protein